MRIPERHLFTSLLHRSLVSAAAAALALALLSGSSGCKPRGTTNISNFPELEGGAAQLDARGASVDSEVSLHFHTAVEGTAGSGGTILITAGGTADISSDVVNPATFDVVATRAAMLPFAGVGINVGPGQTQKVQGGLARDFLWVQPGGKLVLEDNTFITLTGSALIEGEVDSSGDTGVTRQDGHDFVLVSAGSVLITGTINCSGEHAQRLPAANAPPGSTQPSGFQTLGGNGGTISITSTGNMMVGPVPGGPSAQVLANGGGNDSQDPANGLSGTGGTITLSSGGTLSFAGIASARAGDSFTNSVTPGPHGGSITFDCNGNLLMRGIEKVNVTGGRNTGTVAGNGGAFTVDATSTATIDSIDIDASGGRVFFRNGSAGSGGAVTLKSGGALTISSTLSSMTVVASGGPARDPAQGTGGDAGTIVLGRNTGASITPSITVGPDVLLEAQGGAAVGVSNDAGTGGSLQIRTTTLTFDPASVANVLGGNNFGGQQGDTGSICVCNPASLSPATLASLTGVNPPVVACSTPSTPPCP